MKKIEFMKFREEPEPLEFRRVTIRVLPEKHASVRAFCKREGISLNLFMNEAIDVFLKKGREGDEGAGSEV